MLARIQRNYNSHVFLIGLYNGTAALEIGLADPQIHRDTILPISSTPPYPKERTHYASTKNHTWIFISALIIRAKNRHKTNVH